VKSDDFPTAGNSVLWPSRGLISLSDLNYLPTFEHVCYTRYLFVLWIWSVRLKAPNNVSYRFFLQISPNYTKTRLVLVLFRNFCDHSVHPNQLFLLVSLVNLILYEKLHQPVRKLIAFR